MQIKLLLYFSITKSTRLFLRDIKDVKDDIKSYKVELFLAFKFINLKPSEKSDQLDVLM